MRVRPIAIVLLVCVAGVAAATLSAEGRGSGASKSDTPKATQGWDATAAAKYLDDREVWWQAWPHAQKDHGTVCVSCHTQVPYALARPVLRNALGQHTLTDPESAMIESVVKRVNLGDEAKTFYTDAQHGPGKTKEARNAEAVNNALILASYDAADTAGGAHMQPVTFAAFSAMWKLQERTGDKAGAWVWQNFHFSPWEAPESEYWGACMAAVATGIAPDHYREDARIQPNLKLLRDYLLREEPHQPMINRVALLWASSKLPGLMSNKDRDALARELAEKQHADGGWSVAELGTNAKGETVWKRHDDSSFNTNSDGVATGLIVLALEESGMKKNSAELKRGLAWLETNQNKDDGKWPAWSLNLKRDPNSDVGKFMSDAATGFSVLALERSR
ncbi:hypothetical protein ACFPT7_10410 [Acidicapsa dinghuensis]|uniref:Squalene--hopene cyclase n=1 Tax=Acidicapsa dinghuensis TaxID=2218256 RepID=A0ABW1EEE3_9BACT|nr:hypothetical protein [Acidicapsa dinghuensis]